VSFLYVPHLYNPMGLAWSRLTSDFTGWSRWLRSNNNHDVEESWYAWWKQQMEFRNGATPLNKVIILVRELRFLLLALCFAEAANWPWHEVVKEGEWMSFSLEYAWRVIERSPVLTPAIFMALLVVSMAISTHNKDHHPKFYKPGDRNVNGFCACVSNVASRGVSMLTGVIGVALVGLFMYLLVQAETHRLTFGTIVGGMAASFIAFFCLANILAECFGVITWPVVVETIRLWHFALGVVCLAPLLGWSALKYLFNSSELQMYYLLNSYGVRRSLLHMGHVGKMLHKIRREQRHPYSYNSKTQGLSKQKTRVALTNDHPDISEHEGGADQNRGGADYADADPHLPAFGTKRL